MACLMKQSQQTDRRPVSKGIPLESKVSVTVGNAGQKLARAGHLLSFPVTMFRTIYVPFALSKGQRKHKLVKGHLGQI